MSRVLSDEFVKNLIKKADDKLPRVKPIFTQEEHNAVRRAVKLEQKALDMRGKVFTIRYFTWHKEPWITIRPTKGFVPMFSMPRKKLFDPELEI